MRLLFVELRCFIFGHLIFRLDGYRRCTRCGRESGSLDDDSTPAKSSPIGGESQ